MLLRNIQRVVLGLALVGSEAGHADDLEAQKKALQLIREAADDICGAVGRDGSRRSVELSGDTKAKLGSVVGKIADLGIEGAGKYNSDEYKNVLQKDLATLIQSNMDCRKGIFTLLQEKMIGPLRINSTGSPKSAPPAPSAVAARVPDIRAQLHDSIKVSGRYVTYLDGSQGCHLGFVCGTASFIIENKGGLPFAAAIRAGATSIGPCVGREMEAAGLRLYSNNSDSSKHISFDAAQTYISPNARIPVTIKLWNCTKGRMEFVDVSATLTISVDGRTFDMTVTAPDVPVQ